MSSRDSAPLEISDQDFIPALPLFDLFERVVRARPDAPALISEVTRLSYGELHARATALAVRLVRAGMRAGDLVGIVSGRSTEALIAMLAILRAGGAYMPLDPTYAREQLDYMVADAGPVLLLHASGEADLARTLAQGRPVLAVAGEAPVPDEPRVWPFRTGADLAYVMYTSGSTGKPKGVEIPQQGVARLAIRQPDCQYLPSDIALHSSTFGCDGSTLEIWGPLLNGAALVVLETPKPALDALAETIDRHGVTALVFYTGIFHLMAEHHPETVGRLRLVIVGGDVMMPRLAAEALKHGPNLKLVNAYGPTENTVIGTLHVVTPADFDGSPLPIGRAAAHDEVLVLDESLTELPDGEAGQLALTGPGLARGYRNKPEQTAERFVPDPRPGRHGRIYLTGDLVRRRADGEICFLGRLDRQVKLGGRRIELDEVEHVLRRQELVADGSIDLIRAPNGDRRIAGFAKLAAGVDLAPEAAADAIRAGMAKELPEAMVPGLVLVLDELPLTAANKIDRKALVAMVETRQAEAQTAPAETPAPPSEPALPAARPAPRTAAELRARIAALWQRVLGCGAIPPDRTFFEMGGSSLQLIDVHALLEKDLGRRIDITVMFETPRLQDLAARLAALLAEGGPQAGPEARSDALPDDGAIAIVGMAGRFPGAPSVAALWQHVTAGTNLFRRFEDAELEDAFTPAERAARSYVPVRPGLEGADLFDARYFGMYSKEAAVTDPQARVFLETCVEALEDAGVDPARHPGAIGVFAGASFSTYLVNHLLRDRATAEAFTSGYQVGMFPEALGNIADTLATRVAFKLGLRGPALTVSTACSTSLVAIAQACLSLRAGQSDMAIAGGVSITFPQRRGYHCTEGGMVSESGTCRPFDARADGTVFGHGAGAVVLMRLRDAQAAGHTIHAVIRGIGINNDGRDKIAYTAPSVAGQAAAIRMAHRDGGTDPASVGYVECHGTATPLGDPIEVRGLATVFGDLPRASVALGSLKGTIGHLDAAAGVSSVIKTALVLREGLIPPMPNFERPNPKIPFDDLPFRVPTALAPWAGNGPRRAGVSSFGVGGTNVHLVLEEPPAVPVTAPVTAPQILPLSARSPEALSALALRMAEHLETRADDLADVAFTLQEGRTVHDHRLAVAARDPAEAAARLRKAGAVKGPVPADPPPVVFLFPGQGSQYPGMGSGLYAEEPEYRRWIDEGAAILEPLLGLDINRLLCFGDTSDADMARALRDTRLTQPALFLTQVATAKLWLSRGIRPTAMIGHSVGEFAAAVVSGAMSFADGLKIIARRGQLMQDMPGGAMLAVRAEIDRITPLLLPGVDLAARNAPKLNVLAGSFEAIAAMEAALQAAGIACSRLHTSHAFHSAMMDPVCAALAGELAGLALKAGEIPWISCVTGARVTENEARDPAYWAHQARATVDFDAAIRVAASEGQAPVLLEVGAGSTLSTFAAQCLSRLGHGGILQSLPDHTRPVPDGFAMAEALAGLWAAGVPVDWSLAPRGHRRLSLPTYPFERRRHWIDAPPLAGRATAAAPAPAVAPQPVALPAPAGLPAAALPVAAAPPPPVVPVPQSPSSGVSVPMSMPSRSARLASEVLALLADLSGEELGSDQAEASFLELGFDSLFLGQVTQRLSRDYGLELTFRQLLSDYPSVAALAAHMDAVLPPDSPGPAASAAAPFAQVAVADPSSAAVLAPPAMSAAVQAQPAMAVAPLAAPALPAAGGLVEVLQSQMLTMQAIFAEQLRALGQGAAAAPAQPVPVAAMAPAPVSPAPVAVPSPAPLAAPAVQTAAEEPPAAAPFRFGRGVDLSGGRFDARQQAFVDDLARRYSAKHAGSKAHTAKHRAVHADPRTAAGFRQEWKELVFPIVAERAKGSRIWDIDGNEFVDLVNGFGQTAFGHSPDFVLDAVRRQLEKGFPIGPQAELAGPVAAKFARMVGHERVTFCNTGSEAVMAAMRLARAVTGRDRIVVFGNDYHGQFDEVLVKGRTRGGDPIALPIAPGIPRSGLGNMVVLGYGAPESLDWLRANGQTIAAVIVEPVQSRHPELRPAEFVRELRTITAQQGAALVMDEVVTGFRTHRRGMQGLWGIEADMATYGKVPGGGMPVGVLAGKARFMNALDGGIWGYGDDSRPDTPPTFFAGTFVRHPLVVAAVDAVLDHLETQGDALWTTTAERTARLAARLNRALAARGLPDLIRDFSSWFALNLSQHEARASLAYPLMRMEGIHIIDSYCGFLTTTHGEEECDRIARAFESALDQLQSVGILAPVAEAAAPPAAIAAPAAATPAAAAPPTTAIPLTEAQREIWMTSQLGDAASCSFNEGASLHLDGPLDVAALEASLSDILARHDSLRLVFARSGESFDVADPAPVALPVTDLSAAPDPEAAMARVLQAEAETPLDLVAGPPIRFRLLRRGPDRHTLVATAHHIVCDGWSYNVIFTDLAALYAARVEGRAAALPPAPSFAAHALARRSHDPAHEAWWRGEYATVPALPDLPGDRPHPAIKSFRGGTVTERLDAEVLKLARKAGAKQGCTLFSTLFAALQITLGRLSGAGDVVLAVPTGGQALLPDPNLVGHCVNFLPVRAPFAEGATVAGHLKAVRDKVLAALDHSDVTYGTLVRELKIERSLNRLPLTEVQFNLEKVAEGLAMPGLAVSTHPNPKAAVNFDLFFNMIESREGLRLDVDYNSDVYDAATVRRWIGHFAHVLRGMAENADRPLASLPLVDEGELPRLAPTAIAPPAAPTLHGLVAAAAARRPDAPAVEFAGRRLSHAELARQSDALAARLLAALPGGRGRVAVALDRSEQLPVALLGVLKAGHAFVPLDPRHPETRLRHVLEAAGVQALILPEARLPAYAEGLGIAPVAVSGEAPEPVTLPPTGPDDPAYVIFTSGSTGTPKGVEIPHRAVVNCLSSMAAEPGFTAADRLLSVTTVSFDIAILELFLPLIAGGSVVVAATEDVLDGFRLAARLGQGDITVMQATPTLWGMLLEAGLKIPAGLKVMAGGEPLPLDLARRLMAEGADLWNLYGPTETTIWSAVNRIRPEDATITIGHPIANTTLHVLSPEGLPLPVGVTGELNIGGAGLAIGYFGREDLTRAAFRDLTVGGTTQRLYRTGDRARLLADGSVELLGRGDGQIKLRGFRIELGEIEMALRATGGVAQAAVDLRTNPRGEKQLVAWIVPEAGAAPTPEMLMEALERVLPNYMVPSRWVTLSALPQTLNGKLDRKALPAPEAAAPVTPLREMTRPTTPLEERLSGIWAEVLGMEAISTTDTLYALGADSLTIFRIAARMLDAGLNLEARDLLQHPTIRDLAAFAASRETSGASAGARPSLRSFRHGARREGAIAS
ncbi:amino acid adenylation domain-containing protein [Cereibacter sphaeroides]|uniref:non-ribosomal peptide synthetase/type I polyketide synthase n=1 Tax=Cereibacter sphaeroides TaxID=1063 RepID=UPI001F257476|nr:non-ribosomal peptide synthetase/type I polyketide synthase [Cereibacter sphaeroides]MCE6958681.1 amino acid adenylation domain-containing protein [Cereibacter sphaeroides]MCE6973436.1 amino acid adenylation domain-containing protein [Cereibacter sphaeroides]